MSSYQQVHKVEDQLHATAALAVLILLDELPSAAASCCLGDFVII
jgi:hypothetical protein